MQLNIQNVTPETVEVQGQSVTRTFAEGVMLSGLIAGAGKNDSAREAIVKQYLDAGLIADAFPAVVNAASIARMVLTTEASVVDKPQEEGAGHGVHGHHHH